MPVILDRCLVCNANRTSWSAAELLARTVDPGAVQTAVYVALNSADDVLYVGVTQTGLPRFSQHASDNAHWWLQTQRLILRHYTCRHDALDVEAFLIRELDPEWNTAHPQRDFERGEMLVLREHFETDLPALERYRLEI